MRRGAPFDPGVEPGPARAKSPGDPARRIGCTAGRSRGSDGRADEFVMDPENGHITHLTMRKGHIWGDEEVSVPVTAIGRIAENAVYLKLDKRQIKALPMVRVRRKWR